MKQVFFRSFFGKRILGNKSEYLLLKNQKIFLQIRNKNDLPKSNNEPILNRSSNIFSSKNLALVGGFSGVLFIGYYLNTLKKKKNIQKNSDDSTKNEQIHDNNSEIILDLPNEIEYLIIGGGTSAFAALRSIRANQPKSKVIVISDKEYYPYMKPPLFSELWFSEPKLKNELKYRIWNDKDRSIFFTHEEFYFDLNKLKESDVGGVSIIRNHKVVKLDPNNQIVKLDNGQELKYEKCLLATGYKLKENSLYNNSSNEAKTRILKFNDIDDFKKLSKIVDENKSIVIIGENLVASKLNCAISKKYELSKSKAEVTQIIPGKANLVTVLPEFLSEWTTKCLKNNGMNIIDSTNVESIQFDKNKLKLKLSNGKILETDYVVLEYEIEPNTELAKESNLEICPQSNAFLVNSELQARTNLWVAGAAASIYDIKLGRRNLISHDSALITGRLAGENMTSNKKIFWNQPHYWLDLGPEIGFEALGLIDPSLPTVSVFAKFEKELNNLNEKSLKDKDKNENSNVENNKKLFLPTSDGDYKRGVVFYLKNNYVVGILMWNIFGKSKIARRIINEHKTYEDLTELAKHFDLHMNYLEEDEN